MQQYNNSYNQAPRTPMGGLNGPCYTKLLVTSGVAGSIIGKHGEEIANTEKTTGCTIRLSNSQSFFPSTSQRICVISGTLENVLHAIEHVLTKVMKHIQTYGIQEFHSKGEAFNTDIHMMHEHDERMICTLVVPKTAVSAIIGKGGQTIKTTSETSGAKVAVSERDNGLLERLVYFFGGYENVKKAVHTVVQSIQDDPKLRESCLQLDYRTAPFPEAPMQAPPMVNYGYSPYSSENASYPGIQPTFLNSQCEIIMHIPDSSMGAVIGKQGSCMTEIMRRTGAKILVSQKGVLVPNTTNREVTITGTVISVHQAHAWLVQLYLTSLTEEQNASYANDPTLSGQAFRLARSRATLYNPYAQNP